MCLLALAAAATWPACKGSSKQKPADPQPSDAGPADAPSADAPPVDLSFASGTIVVAREEDHHHVTALALDPATAQWVPLAGDSEWSLFPTGHLFSLGFLVIATQGESQADHVEQLGVLRRGKLELFGPKAGAVRNPTVSHDGTLIVVETSENNFRDLYKIDEAGKSTRLTDNREGNFEPSLSPDAKHVVFSSSRDGDSEVYRVPVRGGAATRLTAFHKDDWSPLWSPDGTHVAFLSDREGPPRLFLMAPDGTGQRRATEETDVDVAEDLPRWSPDGTALAFVRGGGLDQTLVVLDVASGKVRRLTPEGHADTDFAWSPDGAYLVAIRRDVRQVRALPAGDLVIVNAADGTVAAPLGSAAGVRFVRWLP